MVKNIRALISASLLLVLTSYPQSSLGEASDLEIFDDGETQNALQASVYLNRVYAGNVGDLTFVSATRFKWEANSGFGVRTTDGTYSISGDVITLTWSSGGTSTYEIEEMGKKLRGFRSGDDYALKSP